MEVNDEFKKDSKEAMKNGILFGFCPQHLSIENRRELLLFPLNILFSRFRNEPDGSLTMGSALYEPDLSSFAPDGEKWSMTYRNKYGGNSYVTITIKLADLSYRGDKFVEGAWVGCGTGIIKTDAKDENGGWELFFFHLTLLGLANGEKCLFEKVPQEKSVN